MQNDKIFAIVKAELVYPFKLSFPVMINFTNLWNFALLNGGTMRSDCLIAIPQKKFKLIWNTNPKVGKADIPIGTEHFISNIEIIRILVK